MEKDDFVCHSYAFILYEVKYNFQFSETILFTLLLFGEMGLRQDHGGNGKSGSSCNWLVFTKQLLMTVI